MTTSKNSTGNNLRFHLRKLRASRMRAVEALTHTLAFGSSMPTFIQNAREVIAALEHDIAELQQQLTDETARRMESGEPV